jgi:hypothetical protein
MRVGLVPSGAVARADATVLAEQEQRRFASGCALAGLAAMVAVSLVAEAGAPVAHASSGKIVVIVMENEPYSKTLGSAQDPYIHSLIAQGELFTSYSAMTSGSLHDYLAMTRLVGSGRGHSSVSRHAPDVLDSIERAAHRALREAVVVHSPRMGPQRGSPSGCLKLDGWRQLREHTIATMPSVPRAGGGRAYSRRASLVTHAYRSPECPPGGCQDGLPGEDESLTVRIVRCGQGAEVRPGYSGE